MASRKLPRTQDQQSAAAEIAARERVAELRARVEALGCEILEDDRDVPDRFYVLDHKAGSRLIVISAEVEDVEEWCEEREAGATAAAQPAAPADDDTEREADDDADTEVDDFILLRGDHLIDLVYAVGAMTDAIEEARDREDGAAVTALLGVLRIVGGQLQQAFTASENDCEFRRRAGEYLARREKAVIERNSAALPVIAGGAK